MRERTNIEEINLGERFYLLATVADTVDHLHSCEASDQDETVILEDLINLFNKFNIQGQA